MNRVAILAEEDPPPSWAEQAHRFILSVLDRLRQDRWDVSALFCGDRYIRDLNARFRGKDEATDVLSFELGETLGEDGEIRRLGDIVISLETLGENARYFQVSADEELRRLLIHGILHLYGMDHATNADIEPMLLLQENLLAELGAERILS
ncbi:MAG: rRNA maturation RNase YbeY [Spirochaetaceae bacterium]|jgi:probable rRNA maturation factor|nr:rRNA maturation RNase YbeY [Spirochaetaceae bacterium]